MKSLESLECVVKGNYIIKESNTLGHKIRLVFPYGLADGSKYYNLYLHLILGVMDNFIQIPNILRYTVMPNTTIIYIDVFDIFSVNFVMGSLFNFFRKVDIDEFFKEDNLIENYAKKSTLMYNCGGYEFIKGDKDSISDLVYAEYQSLFNRSEEEIKDILKENKEKFQEDKCMVFLQGFDVATNTFEKQYEEDGFKWELKPLYLNVHNSLTIGNESGYYCIINDIDSTNYHKYNFIFGYLNSFINNGKFIIDIPGSILIFFNIINTNDEANVFSYKWIESLCGDGNDLARDHFHGFKGIYLKEFTEFYNSFRSDIDVVLEVYNRSQLLYTPDMAKGIIEEISNWDWDDCKKMMKEVLISMKKTHDKRFSEGGKIF